MFKRNLREIILFCIVGVIGFVFYLTTHKTCLAANAYQWSVPLGWEYYALGFIILLLKVLVVVSVVLMLKKMLHASHYKKVKIVLSAILPIFLFYTHYTSIPYYYLHQASVNAICEKSTLKNSTVNSCQLNLTEYNYLRRQFFLLPELPESADAVSIEYFHDTDLGGFSLKVDFNCNCNENIDTQDNRWTITKKNNELNKQLVCYKEYL